MNLLIINQPLNNRGDESAHKALVRSLHKSIPDATITVLFVNANGNSIDQFNVHLGNVDYVNISSLKYYGHFMLLGLRYNLYFLWYFHPTIRKISKYYKAADWVICAPGGICMGGFQNWAHLFFLQLARFYHKKLIYYGRSFGPFPIATYKNRIFKRLSVGLLKYISFLSIRDSKTEILARQLGISYTKTLDTAFLDNPSVELPKELQSITQKKFMVFVPNLLIWHYKYKNQISKNNVITFYHEIVNLINEKYPQYNIVMLPQTFNFGTYLGDDVNFFKELALSINDSRIIVVDDIYSSDVQQVVISKSQFLIGARYHSVVFAINNNIPFVALSYEHKIAGMLCSLDKEESMVDITNISNDKSENQKIIDKIEEKILLLASDRTAQIRAKKIASECFNKLLNTINKS